MTQAAQLATYGSNNVGLSFKNRLINGGCTIDQRNAGASVTLTTPGAYVYSLDRWKGYSSAASKFTIQQNAGSVTPPSGFTNYLGVTSLSSYTVGSSDIFMITQCIEGYNVADLGWGANGASTVTLSFWVRSSLTGTFGGSLYNRTGARSYPFSYIISSANTWEQKSITIVGDTTGTWDKTNTTGIQVNFGLGVGSTFSQPAGAWVGSEAESSTGATSVVGTNGATFYITGVQLEKGSVATSFDYRPYGTELALCQRYYQTTGSVVGVADSTTSWQPLASWGTTMRTSPTMGLSGVYVISDGYSSDFTQSSATIGTYSSSLNSAMIRLSTFTGLTATRFYQSRLSNTNLITMSAEL